MLRAWNMSTYTHIREATERLRREAYPEVYLRNIPQTPKHTHEAYPPRQIFRSGRGVFGRNHIRDPRSFESAKNRTNLCGLWDTHKVTPMNLFGTRQRGAYQRLAELQDALDKKQATCLPTLFVMTGQKQQMFFKEKKTPKSVLPRWCRQAGLLFVCFFY